MQEEILDTDVMIKLVTVGESGVGKTNIISRYVKGEYNESMMPTVGIDFSTKNLEVDGSKVSLQIWDTAGQERMRAMASAYYREAQGALLIYDISSKESFDRIVFWLKEIKDNGNERIKIILLGNKSDLSEDRHVTIDEAQSFAKEHGFFFMEVSAKTNPNNCIDRAFIEMIRTIMADLQPDEIVKLRHSSHLRKTFQSDLEIAKKRDTQFSAKKMCCL